MKLELRPPAADAIRRIVRAALDEDLSRAGDVTSDAAFEADHRTTARIVTRSALVLAGIDVAREVFSAIDPEVRFRAGSADGDRLEPGATVAEIEGPTQAILSGERTALNFLMRMCGIATATARAVDEIDGTGARILDTRKTAPGLRVLDKYAVACGGGTNHRMGLYDAVMIKDTHADAGCTVAETVKRVRDRGLAPERITVEVRDLDGLDEAIAAGAGRVLLDNMTPPQMRRAVERAAGRVILEASGGLRPGSLREVAATGVDCLSLGWLTHSAPASDLALETERGA